MIAFSEFHKCEKQSDRWQELDRNAKVLAHNPERVYGLLEWVEKKYQEIVSASESSDISPLK